MLTKIYGEGPDPVMNIEECSSEWECLKRLTKNNYASMTMQQLCRRLCTDLSLRDTFPQLTTGCEHAFSSMNRIKTELRNRLKTSKLDCLMRISIEGHR